MGNPLDFGCRWEIRNVKGLCYQRTINKFLYPVDLTQCDL